MTGPTTGPARVAVTVDGVPRTLRADLSLLHALREEGIRVPALCDDVRLPEPIGSCGLCVVSLDGGARRAQACSTPVTEGLVVDTASADVVAFRRLRLEQLLADHDGDCEAPCQATCPAHVDIQLYLRHVANGNMEAALRVIKETNPFPSACGRVCPHTCESACRRNLVDDPVAINAVKRFAADWDLRRENPWRPAVAPTTGRRVAVVGAGPSGLSCASYLAQRGHHVTVYEKQPQPGGMMRYGIPEYRLPKAILDREIASITDLGVEIRCGQGLGMQHHLSQLRTEHDAVYLAFGSWQATPLAIDGDTLPGVHLGIDFLQEIAKGTPPALGSDVVVVGGGNTAIDCVRTALRLGATNVSLVYRRTVDEMPAEAHEVADAIDEGVQMVFLAAPTAIRRHDGRLELECLRMELGEPDRSGRRRPTPVPGSEFTLVADTVVGAIGQSTQSQFLYDDLDVATSHWGDIDVDGTTMATNQRGIFAGGDCVTGPATVVQAVGAGRRAADAIDEFLRTGAVTPSAPEFAASRGTLEDLPRHEFEAQPRLARTVPAALAPADRLGSFAEVELTLDEAQARAEAARCLACGCSARYGCELRDAATEHGVRHHPRPRPRPRFPLDTSHPFLVRDPNKCIACGKCIAACADVEGVDVLGYRSELGRLAVGSASGLPLLETACVSCGQCATACPCGALDFRRETDVVWQAINDPTKTVVATLAPAPRAVVAASYGIGAEHAGPFTAGLLRALGFDSVFDVAFAADLTIVEEATEFLERVAGGGVLPQFTSCCPGWVNHVEKTYPVLISNLSSCRSPQGMMAATLKTHYARVAGVDPEDLVVVSVMPCLAKKDEARREQLGQDGRHDVDAVLTTQELLEMADELRLDAAAIVPGPWDAPYTQATGAGVIFGASGGVAEAAMRMAVEELTGRPLHEDDVDMLEVRGLDGVREATLTASDGTRVRVAVVSGLGTARPLIEKAARGEDTGYDLVEIMACPGGCIGGAGNPLPRAAGDLPARQDVLYDIDKGSALRASQGNADVWTLYDDFYTEPGSPRAHELLHTTYVDRRLTARS